MAFVIVVQLCVTFGNDSLIVRSLYKSQVGLRRNVDDFSKDSWYWIFGNDF